MMMSSTTITLNEEDRQSKSIYIFSQSHVIEHLKPCTEYEHSVAFIDAGKATPCNPENETMTSGMSKDDIKEGSCMPGYVCYQSDWDISSSLSASNNVPAEPCKTDNKTFCIKPDYDDICTDLTTTFHSENCTASFDVTKSITVDFLNASEITQKAPTELPVKKIETELPPNCTDLTVDYTCQEDGKPSNTKNLTELEPFTDYSCTGQIKENNITKKTTNAVKFRIDCDITIIETSRAFSNTYIQWRWDMISQNCPGLLGFEKFSYDCSCRSSSHQNPIVPANKEESGGTFCKIAGLKPFTDYTCKVQPKYDNKKVHQPTEVKQKTLTGRPEDIHDLTVIVVDHNVIRVKCDYKGRNFNGPERIFIARLHNAGVPKELRNTTCDFEFKDLSYLTEYNVEVTAYNGRHESNPKKNDHMTTSCMF
ncbi:receptor-type tyrosine-protein phosphatase C-like [Sebastes fasciatus]|uniref:receptor-type tyrosine-protein phosphatase C-like n=1 Tax=Sebastes fasciatus TaxID=394691 RepID=UPI003D9DE079